jgi:hypothetical protein
MLFNTNIAVAPRKEISEAEFSKNNNPFTTSAFAGFLSFNLL